MLQTWLWTLRQGEGTPCRPKARHAALHPLHLSSLSGCKKPSEEASYTQGDRLWLRDAVSVAGSTVRADPDPAEATIESITSRHCNIKSVCDITQVIRFRCTDEQPCDGLGDRVKGLNVAFWLVPPSELGTWTSPFQTHADLGCAARSASTVSSAAAWHALHRTWAHPSQLQNRMVLEARRLPVCAAPPDFKPWAVGQTLRSLGTSAKRRIALDNTAAVWQAVLTDSVLLVDILQPVPIEEFLQPYAESLRFADVRECYFDDVGALRKVRCHPRALDICRVYGMLAGGSATMRILHRKLANPDAAP